MKQTMSLLIAIGFFISIGCSKESVVESEIKGEVKGEAKDEASSDCDANTSESAPAELKPRATEPAKEITKIADEVKKSVETSETVPVDVTTLSATPPAVPKGITLQEFWKGLDIPEVVAVVGGKNITKGDLLKEIENQTPPSMKGEALPPRVFAQISEKLLTVLDTMITRNILLDQAKIAGILASEKALAGRVDQWLKDMPAEQKEGFATQLKMQGSSIEKYRKDTIENVSSQEAEAIDQWITAKLMPTLNVDDAAIDKYYRENQEMFKKPETVKVAHILIAPEKPSPEKFQKMSSEEKAAFAKNADEKATVQAEKLLAELKQGADFAKLAKENSICPSKNEGGALPAFDKTGAAPGSGGRGGRMVQPFTDASFKINNGDLSDLVKTQFGYHIIKSLERNKESYAPLESVKGYLKDSLQKEQLNKKMKSLIDSEKEKLNIKVFLKDKVETSPDVIVK